MSVTVMTGDEDVCDVIKMANKVTILENNTCGVFVGLLIDLNAEYQGRLINRLFVKLYLDIDYYKNAIKYEETKDGLYGIQYETKIYKHLLGTEIKYPHNFLQYYSGGKSNSFEDIDEALINVEFEGGKLIHQNLFYLGGNPLVNLSSRGKNHRITASIMEAMRPNSFGIRDTFYRIVKSKVNKDMVKINRNVMPILTQILFGCIAMEEARLMHNDLHINNINLEELSEPIILTYKLGDKTYTLQTEYLAKIFDFDRGYIQSLGNNLNVNEYIEDYSVTNELVPGRDFIRFCVNLQPMIHLLKMLVPSSTVEEDFMNIMVKMSLTEDTIYRDWLRDIMMANLQLQKPYLLQMELVKADFSEEVRTQLPTIKDLPEDYRGGYPNEFFLGFKELSEMVPLFVK